MGLSTLELLRLGQVAIGDAPVALGSAYADVFEQVPDLVDTIDMCAGALLLFS